MIVSMFLSTVLPGGKRLYLPLLQQRRAGSVNGWGQRRAEANLGWNPERSNSNVPLDGMLNFNRLSSFEKKTVFLNPFHHVPPHSQWVLMGPMARRFGSAQSSAPPPRPPPQGTAATALRTGRAHRGSGRAGSCRVEPSCRVENPKLRD